MERPEKLTDFIKAVTEKNRKDNLKDMFDKYGISEKETQDCMEYLQQLNDW